MHLWMVLKNRWSWRVAYNIHCVHRGRHDVAISISFFRHVVHSDVATKKRCELAHMYPLLSTVGEEGVDKMVGEM
jgi:hypothetical protein